MKEQKTERNMGIDLLRIVSMFMIATMHVLGQGKVLETAQVFSPQYECAWLLEIAAFCGVNCFALISGFVGYGRKVHYKNLLCLYFEVIFYTLLITVIFHITNLAQITWKDYLAALFPFATGTYWYFTVYFAMFFFTPFFGIVLEHLTEKQGKIFLGSVFAVFCILPIFMREDLFGLSKGYSVIWISLMYLVGGCLRKFGFGRKKSAAAHLRNYTLLVLMTWASKYFLQMIHSRLLGVPGEGMHLISYISPTIFLAGVELLLFLQKIKIGETAKKWIVFFAPVAFDVFLIHEHPLVVSTFMERRFMGYVSLPALGTIGMVILTAFLIWLGCSLLGRIRVGLFSLLKIGDGCMRIENALSKKLESLLG